jgi:hypothetical protein
LTGGLSTDLTRDELAETTAHGLVYLRRLRHSQLMLSLLVLVAFGGLVGALPLFLFLVPSLSRVTFLGVPLTLVLMLAPFPLCVGIGWLYERRADALDGSFRDLIAEEDQ